MTTEDMTAENTPDDRHPIPVRLDIEAAAPKVLRAMGSLDAAASLQWDVAELDPALRELVRLRASQLNGCAYCVATHSSDARAAGTSEGRLAAVAVWEESPFFTDRERAAFALAEQITLLADTRVPDAAWASAAAEFSDVQLGALVSVVVAINAWNMLAVSTRAWTPAE